MKVLVVGGGGREHALASRLAADASVREVLCAPGNAGTATIARNLPVGAGDVDGLLALAETEAVDLTVVGPELPLERGLVDRFSERNLAVLGPSQAAARLETSKVFAKGFMARHGIPTPRYRVCESARQAYDAIAGGSLGLPLVVKADGLAAGKGVVVATDRAAADSAVRAAMEDQQFGAAGARVVLEECLSGPEVSFFALCDGRRAVPLRSAQDHKRAYEDDRGPNTGGMGAFSPSPLLDAALHDRILNEIVQPTIDGAADEGMPYSGFLYVGLMLTCDGPRVIEFNVRFGDPEAQVVVPAIEGDLATRLAAAAAGRLDDDPVPFTADRLVGVVMASEGYPASAPTGRVIHGLAAAAALPGVTVFHSGTAARDGAVVTAGGRVLTVVGRGSTFTHAIERAYAGVAAVSFEGVHFRRDIGARTRGSETP